MGRVTIAVAPSLRCLEDHQERKCAENYEK